MVDAILEVSAASAPTNARRLLQLSAAMPPAARLTDLHTCPMQTPAVPHGADRRQARGPDGRHHGPWRHDRGGDTDG